MTPSTRFAALKAENVASWLVPLLLVALWHLASLHYALVPSPWQVARKWFEYASPISPGTGVAWLVSGELFLDVAATLSRVIPGFFIGLLLAVPLGLVMGTSRLAYHGLAKPIELLRHIAPYAWIPVAMLLFGIGNAPAIFLIALAVFFQIHLATLEGVRQIDPVYLLAARNLGLNRRMILIDIVMPAALQSILTGARISLGVGFAVVVVAEMIAGPNGLGYRLIESREYSWMDKIVAGMLSIGVVGMGINAIVARANRYFLRWHQGIA